MENSLKASELGLQRINQARKKKGWNKTSPAWCSNAFTSKATLNRFWARQAIRSETFTAICQAVEVNWQIVVEGAFELDSDSNFYVERSDLESFCCQSLLQPGSLLCLKGDRSIGKTSLIDKVLARVKINSYAVANLSLKLADQSTHFTSIDKFLRWFSCNLSLQLGLPNRLQHYWDEENLGSKVSCSIYLREYVLARIPQPLVLCIDDVDLLLPYQEIYQEFLNLLRSWYEKAKIQKPWSKLRLAVIYTTNAYIHHDLDLFPLDLGVQIELPEFTKEQARELAFQHQLDLTKSELESLLDLVGGHPYLLQQAFIRLRSDRKLNLKQLLAEATTKSGIYSDRLRQSWIDLEQHSELIDTYREIVLSPNPIYLDPVKTYQLQNIGLVKLAENRVEPRCNLYRQFFAEHFKQDERSQIKKLGRRSKTIEETASISEDPCFNFVRNSLYLPIDKSCSNSYEMNLVKFIEMTQTQQNNILDIVFDSIIEADPSTLNQTQAEYKLTGQKLTIQILQLILDTIPKRIFWKDKNFRYLGCNKLFARDAGLDSPEQIIGKSDFELAWQQSAALYRADDKSVIQSNISKINYEEPQVKEDGTAVLLRTSKIPLQHQNNEVSGVFGCYWSISELPIASQSSNSKPFS